MRTALLLLFLLALAAVPGSVLPQRGLNPIEVRDFYRAHPTLAPLLDRLSLFDVFAAPWFAATYLLLFLSLAGCVIPRSRLHWRAMRARPPAAPRNLGRLPASRSWETGLPAEAAVAAGAKVLRRRRYRVDVAPAAGAVSAEKGHLRETGNLAFHLALLGLLAAVGLGSVFGFHGTVLVKEGGGFANTVTQYDEFAPGRAFNAADLSPFSFTLADFRASFAATPEGGAAAREFAALVDYRATPTAAPSRYNIRVNHPLVVDGTKVFLMGHGYAPRFTVRDGEERIVVADAVPFLPQDGNFSSTGVVKVPDARPDQLGLEGFFLPTAVIDQRRGPVSVFPDARNPVVFLTVWRGDLGLDTGRPQSVYRLDTSRMEQLRDGAAPLAASLAVGETLELPNGLGSITFDGFDRWATFRIARDPGKELALASASLAIAGVLLSLTVRRRRVWVRAAPGPSGRTVVEVAGLGRSEQRALAAEVDEIAAELRGQVSAADVPPPAGTSPAMAVSDQPGREE